MTQKKIAVVETAPVPYVETPPPALPSHQQFEPLPVALVIRRLGTMREIIKQAMTQDIHYGVIPGTGKKPTLLKPGAELLLALFQFRTLMRGEDTPRDLGNGHREYIITCSAVDLNGQVVAQAAGSCSTMESKYRWRKAGRSCPSCGTEGSIIPDTDFKTKERRGWLCWAKKGGCGAKFGLEDTSITSQEVGRVENEDPADQYNTVLKMATKRALVAVALLVTGASEHFTQDVEDFQRDLETAVPKTVAGAAVIPADDLPESFSKPFPKHRYDLTNYPIEEMPKVIKNLLKLKAVQLNEDGTLWEHDKAITNLAAYELTA